MTKDLSINNTVITKGQRVFFKRYNGRDYDWSETKAKVMAVADNYAMIRIDRCSPFVAKLEDLKL